MKNLFSMLIFLSVISCSTKSHEQEFDYGQYIDNKVLTGMWTHESSGTIYIDDYHFKNGHQTLEKVSRSGYTTILYLKNVSYGAIKYDFDALSANLYYYDPNNDSRYHTRIKVEVHRVSDPNTIAIYNESLGIKLY